MNNYFESFLEGIVNYLPNVLGAILILIIGFIIASVIRKLVKAGLGKANLNEHTAKKGGMKMNLESIISKFVYYIIVIIVLLVTLSILNVEGVLEPLQNMVNVFLVFIPNLIAAAIIGFAGYLLAKIAAELVGGLVSSLQAASERFGLKGNVSLGNIIQKIVFVLIFVPVLIVALDALQINAISEPATNMLDTLLAAIPDILAAAIILVVFYAIARFITPIVTDILKNMGADRLPEKMGLKKAIGNNNSLSEVTGKLLFFFIMFFGVVSALDKVNLYGISNMLGELLELSAQIVFGLVIIAIGNYLANIAYQSLSDSARSGKTVAAIARYTVLGLFIAIALRTMGIANEIVTLAFGLTLGAAAVAFALSFGLGGREAAGKQMEHMLSRYRNESSSDTSEKIETGNKTKDTRNNPNRPDKPSNNP
jgi:hypothetical protein